jgi:membrane protein implicated in regulation of membrane protease activity
MGSILSIEFVFLASAIIGGVLFLLRIVLLFVGVGGDHGGDLGGAGHVGDLGDLGGAGHIGDFGDMADAGHIGDLGGSIGDAHGVELHDGDVGSTDVSFKFLSIQGVSAFFLLFGLVGLAVTKGGGGVWVSLPAGLAAGLITVWIVGLIFAGMQRLQADGTLRTENAVGMDGTVYLTIPEGGTGKVNVSVQGALREFEAVSRDNQRIETGTRVRVVEVKSGGILVVERSKTN